MIAPGRKIESDAEPIAAPADPVQDEICALQNVRIPHIRIHVFRDTDAFSDIWNKAMKDRRMANATIECHTGGLPGAIEKYRGEEAPELIIVETNAPSDVILMEADLLSELCEPHTQALIVGHTNDIRLYQKLLGLGVSNYLVFPVTISSIIEAISEIYSEPDTRKIGESIAVIGGRGGVGASSIAQNLAISLSNEVSTEVLLVDMDTHFGTVCLNFDIEPNDGLLELVDQAERLDVGILDRVLIKRGLRLNVLTTTPGLTDSRDLDDFTVDRVLDVSTMSMRYTVLDMPHEWSEVTRKTLTIADHVVIVATPDLGCLKNVKSMMDHLQTLRPNDAPPTLVLNQAGMPKRKEISEAEVVQTLKAKPSVVIPFDARLFDNALISAKPVVEVDPKRPASRALTRLCVGLIDPSTKDTMKTSKRKLRLF